MPAGSLLSRYGGNSKRPSAPAVSAARTNCFAIAVPYPQPATTGARWFVCCTAAETTSENSCSVSEKNSPVPPAAKSAAGLCCKSHSRCSRYGPSSKSKASVKCVTGNESRPAPIFFANSSGDIGVMDFLHCSWLDCLRRNYKEEREDETSRRWAERQGSSLAKAKSHPPLQYRPGS